jgi:hypothetical protein
MLSTAPSLPRSCHSRSVLSTPDFSQLWALHFSQGWPLPDSSLVLTLLFAFAARGFPFFTNISSYILPSSSEHPSAPPVSSLPLALPPGAFLFHLRVVRVFDVPSSPSISSLPLAFLPSTFPFPPPTVRDLGELCSLFPTSCWWRGAAVSLLNRYNPLTSLSDYRINVVKALKRTNQIVSSERNRHMTGL